MKASRDDSDPEFMTSCVQSFWLNTLVGIERIGRSDCIQASQSEVGSLKRENAWRLQIWRDIGTGLHSRESEVRSKLVAHRKSAYGLSGCSWERCVLHGEQSMAGSDSIFLCTGCRKVSGLSNTVSVILGRLKRMIFRRNIVVCLVKGGESHTPYSR